MIDAIFFSFFFCIYSIYFVYSVQHISSWMTANLLTLNSSKTEFLLIGHSVSNNNSLKFTTAHSIPLIQLGTLVSSLTVITFSDQISLSKSCYYHIRELRCIRPYLNFKTANTIATSIVHSKLDYCNSLYYNLPKYQRNRLQVIQNSCLGCD